MKTLGWRKTDPDSWSSGGKYETMWSWKDRKLKQTPGRNAKEKFQESDTKNPTEF